MDTSRERMIIEVFAKDDVKWDKCFVDLNKLGYVTNAKFGAYDPPKDVEENAVYDHAWNREKNNQ